MSVTVVVGSQWGDEGKGKVVDLLAAHATTVIRSQGGSNAGHTVVIGKETYQFHLIPSGIVAGVRCVLGHGLVVDPRQVKSEISLLEARGIPVRDHLLISDRAHLVLPYHPLLDGAQEASRGAGKIGTTNRGIGPAYEDKVRRTGIRAGALASPGFIDQLRASCVEKNAQLAASGMSAVDIDAVCEEFSGLAADLAPLVADVFPVIRDALGSDEDILVEGAQGTMLDLDMGTYPYVTSSSPVAGGACTGTGIPPTRIDRVIGIVKAYTTRVGEGPFPTELTGEAGDALRELGHEYGVTTGRPRRVGWYDGAVVGYTSAVNGVTAIVVTKLDVLDGYETLSVGTGYDANGRSYDYPPSSLAEFDACRPRYEQYPGWRQPIGALRDYGALPPSCRNYVEEISRSSGAPVAAISVGPGREETVIVDNGLLTGPSR